MIDTTKKISKKTALYIYRSLLRPRLIEKRMLSLLRQNKISKWFSGIGQEAIAVGLTLSSDKDDYILPMHRNLGVFTTRNVPLYPLFCQLFGKADGFTLGRERSFHFGLIDKRIVGMVSHLAATMPIADGLALALKLKQKKNVVFSFCGDGATSEGDFHEALNLAGVWKLPVVFMIENNGYGLSTPVSEQYACENLVDRATGYGLEGMLIDGNDIFAVRETVQRARNLALNGTPVLIEAKTFRMRGHEEASGTLYVPDKLLDEWAEKDPVKRFEDWLIENKLIEGPSILEDIKNEIKTEFEPELKKALRADEPVFDENKEIQDAWFVKSDSLNKKSVSISATEKKCERRFIDAIQHALKQAFTEDESFLLLGQDVAEYGGVFKVTEGFLDLFGKNRIRNTPIIESGAIGAAIGLSVEGFKPVVEMQFADFISCGYNQIINNLSKGRYRWMPPLNVTIRAPHGAGIGAGPFHSQSPEGWFMQHSGLRIIVPGTVEDAQDMLYSSLFDPNPVLFFEHKKLYRSIRKLVPEQCRIVDLEKASVLKEGRDALIITYGMGIHWALEIAETYDKKGVALAVLDLRSLAPIDWDTITDCVKATGKVLLLQETSEIMGPMSEISAGITERCFEYLDAPVIRCSSLNTPIPFNKNLEQGYLASYRLRDRIEKLLHY